MSESAGVIPSPDGQDQVIKLTTDGVGIVKFKTARNLNHHTDSERLW